MKIVRHIMRGKKFKGTRQLGFILDNLLKNLGSFTWLLCLEFKSGGFILVATLKHMNTES